MGYCHTQVIRDCIDTLNMISGWAWRSALILLLQILFLLMQVCTYTEASTHLQN